jgi:kynurenine formamidase
MFLEKGGKIKVHDLSLQISNELPVHAGDPVISIEPKVIFEKSGYNVLSIKLGTHAGTHIDAPFHVLSQGDKLEDISLEKFVGNAVFIGLEKKENEAIKPEDLEGWDIEEGDILIVSTGWENKKYMQDYFSDFPYFNEDSADYLISKKIKTIGVDTPSVDGFSQKGIFHRKILNAGIGVIESLINIKPLVGKMMFFSALPLNIKESDGAPVRAVAIEGVKAER